MVVYVTYRVPVEVELETETGGPVGPSGTDPRDATSRLDWSRIGPSQVLPPNEQGATGRI